MELCDRLSAMIWGQFVGDALCLGTHWIHNLEDLRSQYPDLQGFEAWWNTGKSQNGPGEGILSSFNDKQNQGQDQNRRRG